MNEITTYINALTNLYGILDKNLLLDIYNKQNRQKITLDDVNSCYNLDEYGRVQGTFAHPEGEFFIHETVLEFEEFDNLQRQKADKPHYIPKKEELLKYSDQFYFEKNEAYKNFLAFVKANFFESDHESAEELCEEIQAMCQFGYELEMIMEEFKRLEISFKDQDQMKETFQLITDLSNNVRIWENNGHTPREIFEEFEKPHMIPLRDGKPKVGRNDPCPCGSGKKYKKCCLGNE